MERTIVAAMTVTLASCSSGQDLASADKAVERFHQQLNAGQFESIYAQSAPTWKANTPKNDTSRLFAAVRSKLGPYKSGTRNSWRVNYGTNANTVVLFDSVYEKGKAQETFTFANGKNSPLIGYNVNSLALITG
ncbi:MAG: DUF3887 domain-containing protein [Sphingomonas sp.]|nr:DUF3887 domain-containing protein [Sphingomonas sp.]